MFNVEVNQVYRHFKGDYYLVTEVATDSDNQEPCVVYRSLKSERVWVRKLKEFESLVPEEIENLTGQKYRFEKVVFANEALGRIPTNLLIKELYSRPDNPFSLVDIEKFKESIVQIKYVVTRKAHGSGLSNSLVFVAVKNTYEEVVEYLENHLEPTAEIVRVVSQRVSQGRVEND